MSALWQLGDLGSSGILYLLNRAHTRPPTASSHSPTHCYVLQTSSLQLTISETYLFYDPKLLSPSSKAGSDYVPNPSQYKEMYSNYQRRQTRALAAAANKANDTNTKHESNSDCESDSDSFQSLGDRAAATETNYEFPVSVLGDVEQASRCSCSRCPLRSHCRFPNPPPRPFAVHLRHSCGVRRRRVSSARTPRRSRGRPQNIGSSNTRVSSMSTLRRPLPAHIDSRNGPRRLDDQETRRNLGAAEAGRMAQVREPGWTQELVSSSLRFFHSLVNPNHSSYF
ncbi:hypothetical protein K438DRAFT_2025159, partial [Mycena galopus ATCC 62051]